MNNEIKAKTGNHKYWNFGGNGIARHSKQRHISRIGFYLVGN